ncbi:acyl-CoA dehydrogenase family protein [Mariniblastus fucicola]|uniref:Acyl-CoA dehydrogenase, short-chain specific n=1 Tax=Mariniblastus fucicola TaxID=980251 RepID=A0A5B9P359_9BACT|nr:acyl-CoA dehydrogenase family protein [Mariniblastus fucicola]QEG20818.1 Acyl-CoA dehydrogenase, short-chain specific [Mariniblastus fucicola]
MIETPSNPELESLYNHLASLADETGWPTEALQRCADAGFYRWFVSKADGGFGWSATDIAKGYLELSKANLTVTFILTQRVAALRRIAGCENEPLKKRFLEPMLSGQRTATVGISHLTTSRQHLGKPVLAVSERDGGFQANGLSPWVTGGNGADWILMGGSLVDESGTADGREVLFLVETDDENVVVKPGFELIALSSSHTGAAEVKDVFVPEANIVAGPVKQVLTGNGGGAGGLQTSVLALGLAKAAIDFIESESQRRSDLAPAQTALRRQHEALCNDLFAATAGSTEVTAAEVRSQANSLALRSTQSALVAAKGAGFVTGHPVGRWCREALFFLVWSCPHAVSQANLDEFAPCS